MPLRYLVVGMQDVMARGEGPASALPAIGILLALAGRADRHLGAGVPLGRGLAFPARVSSQGAEHTHRESLRTASARRRRGNLPGTSQAPGPGVAL